MSWTLSASGRLAAGLEHLEQELHDALHTVLSEPRFGLLVSHFQGDAVDRLHTVGQAPGGKAEASAPAQAVPAAEAVPEAPAVDVADPAEATDKPAKAAAKGG